MHSTVLLPYPGYSAPFYRTHQMNRDPHPGYRILPILPYPNSTVLTRGTVLPHPGYRILSILP